jgi:amino acid transporter
LIFYIGGVTVAGLLVPSNSPRLASVRGHGTAQASPFVIAINNGGISVLPDIVNGAILLSAYSTGNTALCELTSVNCQSCFHFMNSYVVCLYF